MATVRALQGFFLVGNEHLGNDTLEDPTQPSFPRKRKSKVWIPACAGYDEENYFGIVSRVIPYLYLLSGRWNGPD